MDDELKNFLKNVTGVIEATRFEQHCLWKEYKSDWTELLSGYHEIVGYYHGRPVCISLSSAIIKGKKILFIDAVSQVVDYLMIDNWLKQTLPETAFIDGFLNRTDAMNFHNIFRR